jgi:hypothetical protein
MSIAYRQAMKMSKQNKKRLAQTSPVWEML